MVDGFHLLLPAVDEVIVVDGEEKEATMTLLDFIAGAARRSIDRARVEAETGEDDEVWWSDRSSFWEEWFDAERYPIIARIYAEGGYEEEDETAFAYGLARVLDGIAARVDFKSA